MTPAPSAGALGCLLGPNEVLVAERAVTEDEQATLFGWLEAQRRAGKLVRNPQDPGAYSTPFRAASGDLTRLTKDRPQAAASGEQKLVWIPDVAGPVDPLPEEFWRIRARLIDRLDLGGLEEDVYKGSFMSYIEPGTGVHRHRDDRLKLGGDERLILRCNVLLRRPGGGGLPVFDERIELDIPDRGMWAFFPTELVHAATEVRGDGARALLSFGFLVRPADLLQRRFHLARRFVSERGLADEGARRRLVESVRASAPAAGLSDDRVKLFAFVLGAPGDFTLEEAARALGQGAREVSAVLRDLQLAEIVTSNSSARAERGKVVVI
ncbi:hypothetical protein BE08_23975 [Sorangium cellulosum]|uniref:Uncharacterized protein n=1 Tax=Sorangium cellulosum TaxID=56 RepID=A0A150PDP4_SORCE|nr:hypothetical protein BE08_23975 [Sorangium cellulosum]